MIKGLYSAFTAMDAAWRYQDVLANNIANANTAGYKREIAAKQSFADVLISQQAGVPAPLPSRIDAIVGQIGTGSFIAEFSTDFSSGPLQQTGNELDLATDRGFFAVEAPGGELFYTRDGRFGRDANGDLVTSHGYYVLDVAGGRINLPAGAVEVDSDGVITSGGAFVAQLQVMDFTPAQLTRSGEAYFVADGQGVPAGGVRQGFIERSNSNLVEEMTSMLTVQRAYQANQTVLSTLDNTLDQAASQLGSWGR
ncbi:MAG: flagellar hook-basal body protein [Dehalococcoidia bacterium]|nr:flagellar hook-basal body protein [Dehalococcoidia bacterium]